MTKAKEKIDNRMAYHLQQLAQLRAKKKEEESKEKGIFTGRTEYNLLVHFPGCQDLIGKYVKVKLDTCKGFYYFGTLVD